MSLREKQVKNKPTELFETVFDSCCSGIVRTCACGRTHFDSSDNMSSWEEGELEGLLKKAQEHPNMYIDCDHSIGTMNINGVEVVYDCKCDIAQKYENFILNNAKQIAQYLNKRAKMLRETANEIEITNEK